MNACQCRMARAGLDLTLAGVARLSGVTAMTISRFERGANVQRETVEQLRARFVEAGVEFIDGAESVGVRVPHGA